VRTGVVQRYAIVVLADDGRWANRQARTHSGSGWRLLPCARITSIRFKGTFSARPAKA